MADFDYRSYSGRRPHPCLTSLHHASKESPGSILDLPILNQALTWALGAAAFYLKPLMREKFFLPIQQSQEDRMLSKRDWQKDGSFAKPKLLMPFSYIILFEDCPFIRVVCWSVGVSGRLNNLYSFYLWRNLSKVCLHGAIHLRYCKICRLSMSFPRQTPSRTKNKLYFFSSLPENV